MQRHPSEYFIKYLITLPGDDAKRDDWVIQGVQSIGYPAPTGDYVMGLREEIMREMPSDFNPTDRFHRPSVKFSRAIGVWSLHNPDNEVRAATTLLLNIPARKIAERLLLGRMTPKDVARKVNSRLNQYYTAGGVKAFQHYYWNTKIMKAQDWVDFFPFYEDQNELGRSMAILQDGPAMALHVTGFQQNLETKDMLKEMMESIYFDFRNWRGQTRSVPKTKALTQLAKAAVGIDVRLSEADTALRDSLRAFEQFRMKHAQASVASMDEVAPHGNFSESGAVLKELPAPSQDEKPKKRAKKKNGAEE